MHLISIWEAGPKSKILAMSQFSFPTLCHGCACRVQDFLTRLLSPQTLTVVSPAGNRTSEGGDRKVGEGALLGGHADGIWGPILFFLVQSLHRTELQQEFPPREYYHSTRGDHRRGRHRNSTRIVIPALREDIFLSFCKSKLRTFGHLWIWGVFRDFWIVLAYTEWVLIKQFFIAKSLTIGKITLQYVWHVYLFSQCHCSQSVQGCKPFEILVKYPDPYKITSTSSIPTVFYHCRL